MVAGLIVCRPSDSDHCGSKEGKLCAENHLAPTLELTNYFLEISQESERKTKWAWKYCILYLFTARVQGILTFRQQLAFFGPVVKTLIMPQTDFP